MEGKRETLLASTHTENFCTSYHGNINLEEKEQTLGDFHPEAFLKGKCPEAHPERKRQTNGFVQNPDTRCACASCTYSPGNQADQSHPMWHGLPGHSQPTAHLQRPQQSPQFTDTSVLHAFLLKTRNPPAASEASQRASSQLSCLKSSLVPQGQGPALDTPGDPAYSEAKFLHLRINFRLSLSKSLCNRVGWGNLGRLLMNFPYMQFLFPSKRRIHESMCTKSNGKYWTRYPFLSLYMHHHIHRRLTAGHRRWRCGRTLRTPTYSVTCSLQVPSAPGSR